MSRQTYLKGNGKVAIEDAGDRPTTELSLEGKEAGAPQYLLRQLTPVDSHCPEWPTPGVAGRGVPPSSDVNWVACRVSSSTSAPEGVPILTFGAASPSVSVATGGSSLDGPAFGAASPPGSATTEGSSLDLSISASAGGPPLLGEASGTMEGTMGGWDNPPCSSQRDLLGAALAVSPVVSFLFQRPTIKKSGENFMATQRNKNQSKKMRGMRRSPGAGAGAAGAGANDADATPASRRLSSDSSSRRGRRMDDSNESKTS